MTTEDLKNAIEETADDLLADALPAGFGKEKRKKIWLKPLIAAAACLVIVLAGVMLWPRSGPSALPAQAQTLAQAVYPTMAVDSSLFMTDVRQYGLEHEKYAALEEQYYKALREDQKEFEKVRGNGESLTPFLKQAIVLSLQEAGKKNALSAPLNLYFGLAMLAESTAGETRQEILDALGVKDIKALRTQAQKVWRANFYDDGNVKCVLGSSIWLSNSLPYDEAVVSRLSDTYYASVFRGEMGAADYDELLRRWINGQTGDLLTESTSQLSMDPETLLEVVSTVLFQDKWDLAFQESLTKDGVFHGTEGDTQVRYMYETVWDTTYYYGEHFGAYAKSMRSCGAWMYFILPDEGVGMDELLQDEDLQAFLFSSDAVPSVRIKVHFTMPKFDVALDQDLSGAVKKLGITKIFDSAAADSSSILGKKTEAFVSTVQQGARIIVDEEGVQAAAYVLFPVYGALPPPDDEIDFVLDRPFLFVLRSRDGLPILAGIVNQP